ncbi:hypothetical protein, partial [Enterobacter cloacae]|uniref:hypothetical protein n=1 Tax=Enterobacter cloacae TaxID=550 RepID=UPI0019544F29
VGHHKAREVGTIDDSIRQEQPGQRLNRHPVGADVLLCYEVSPPQVAPDRRPELGIAQEGGRSVHRRAMDQTPAKAEADPGGR